MLNVIFKNAVAFTRSNEGATTIEYALMAAILGIGIIGAVGSVAPGVNSNMETVEQAFIDSQAFIDPQ